jgi:hypothetical protein
VDVIDQLLEVQNHDIEIGQLEREQTDIPARKKAEEERLAEHRAKVEQEEARLKRKQSEIKDLELESEGYREQISKLKKQQLEIKNNKEYKAISAEIRTLEGKIAGIEDRELVAMEELEAIKSDIEKRKAELSEEETILAEDLKELDSRAAEIDKRLQKSREAREQLASRVDSSWLQAYDARMRGKDRALVPLTDGVCGGCHMKLPRYVVHEAGKRNDMVCCDFCGRLLY